MEKEKKVDLVALYLEKGKEKTALGEWAIEKAKAFAREHRVPVFTTEFASVLKEGNEDIEWIFIGKDPDEFFSHMNWYCEKNNRTNVAFFTSSRDDKTLKKAFDEAPSPS